MDLNTVVIISAGTEWRTVLGYYPQISVSKVGCFDFFTASLNSTEIGFLRGGVGKVATASATQFAIDHFNPRLLINIGTCGGIEGKVTLGTLILADSTTIYDIIEGMSDYQQAIDNYATKADLSWLQTELQIPVRLANIYSADRDIRPEDVRGILSDLDAEVGDWESGAFAWVCARNNKDWLVLRAVSDLISPNSGEALNNVSLWRDRVFPLMVKIMSLLPLLIDRYNKSHP